MILSALLHVSCEDVYDKIKEYSPEEVIYPAHFDIISGRVGYERVEIYLSQYGRISSDEMNLGKAKKTVVKYADTTIVYDSLCSWISITDLTRPNMYRFKVYTANDEGDMSIPMEIAMTPYTASDLDALSLSTPDLIQSTSSALVEWKSRLSSDLYAVYAYSYEYLNKNSDTIRGSGTNDAVSFFVENIERNTPIPIDITLKIVPLVAGELILDTLYKTFTTTIIVSETNPVIFLDKPELDAAFSLGFNSTAEALKFSWKTVDEVNDYTLKISDSYSFPDDPTRTFSVKLGNVDNYTLNGEEQLALYMLSNNSAVVRPILYWTVTPTNGDPNIRSQRRLITGKKVIKLTLGTSGRNQVTTSTEPGGVTKIVTSGVDPYVPTYDMNKVINPGASYAIGKSILSFEYKSDYGCEWELFFGVAAFSGGRMITFFVPRSDDWSKMTIDIGRYMESFGWGTATNHRFRFDVGYTNATNGVPTSRTVYIANIEVSIY
jgi:hypothetical protein